MMVNQQPSQKTFVCIDLKDLQDLYAWGTMMIMPWAASIPHPLGHWAGEKQENIGKHMTWLNNHNIEHSKGLVVAL